MTGAWVFVLVFEGRCAKPFRGPASSMEPTLHCAKPGVGCTGSLNDRVLVAKVVYRFRGPRRQEIAVFHAPPPARNACPGGGTYLRRVMGLRGEGVWERSVFFSADGKKRGEP